jgi:hypothetical protein
VHSPSLLTPRAVPSACVNLNLGTIGKVQSRLVARLGSTSVAREDETIVLTCAHSGVPRPAARGLDCTLLLPPECRKVVVFAATHHDVAYYVIVSLAERSAHSALRAALKRRRLEIVFTVQGEAPWWTALCIGNETALVLKRVLDATKGDSHHADESWRDALGELVMNLPSLFAGRDPAAARCSQHAAVLASSTRKTHLAQVERALRETGCE